MESSKSPDIAIIGAGPAGVTLGVLLYEHKIPFTIYELRRKPNEEDLSKPSGFLDLHEGTGLAAVHACKLDDEFYAHTGECSEADVVADKDDTILWADEGSTNRPEISRSALTRLLLSKLPDNCIKWEHRLFSSSVTEDGDQYLLDFGSNHGKIVADLVVGADGAWSRIRPLLTDKRPCYSGVHFLTLYISELSTRHPKLSELVGTGTFAALGDGNGVLSQRGAAGATRLYLAIATPDEEYASSSGLKDMSPQAAKEFLLKKPSNSQENKVFSNFGPQLTELITRALDDHTEGSLDIKALHMLPVGQLAWENRAGVTLVGDAAHLMTPFAGEGVNLAMRDALDLARAIKMAWERSQVEDEGLMRSTFRTALNPAMKSFETAMFERAEEEAAGTLENLKMFTSENAASKLAAFFRENQARWQS